MSIARLWEFSGLKAVVTAAEACPSYQWCHTYKEAGKKMIQCHKQYIYNMFVLNLGLTGPQWSKKSTYWLRSCFTTLRALTDTTSSLILMNLYTNYVFIHWEPWWKGWLPSPWTNMAKTSSLWRLAEGHGRDTWKIYFEMMLKWCIEVVIQLEDAYTTHPLKGWYTLSKV